MTGIPSTSAPAGRIIFVNRVAWPGQEATAQLLQDLAEGLADQGLQIEIVTGTAGPTQARSEGRRVITYHRPPQGVSSARGLWTKATGYRRFLNHARRTLSRVLQPHDLVVAKTDPPMLGAAIAGTVHAKQARLWHWSQDVYPEVALAIAPFGPATALLKLLRPWRDRVWHQSEGVVVIGTDMADLVKRRGVTENRIRIVPNWAPRGLSPQRQPSATLRDDWGVPDEGFVVGYSGNLGRAHTLMPLIDLSAQLQEQLSTYLIVVGDGPQKNTLQEHAVGRQLERVSFHPPVAREQLSESLGAADVHLITMRPECVGTVWPSKFYGVVAANRPMIFIGPREAEVFQLIERHGLGVATTPDRIDVASDFVRTVSQQQEAYADCMRRVSTFGANLGGLPHAVETWQEICGTPTSTDSLS